MLRAKIAALLLLLAPLCSAQSDMEDVLDGFDDMDVYESIELPETAPTSEAFREKTWEFGGSLGLASSYNLIDHQSSSGTDYSGLSRLRARANFGIDGKFGDNWRSKLDLYAWHDLAYRIQGRDYSPEVLDDYKQDLDIQDAWIQGALGGGWDLKLGRQVAVWGFADNLRVLDVLNPLDNLEPGLADVEDLRLPRGMLRLDRFRRQWQLSLFVLPEQRFSRNPPFGSDFYSLTDSNGDAVRIREEKPASWDSLDAAASLVGRFSGWDFSLNLSRHWQDAPYLDASAFDSSDPNSTEADFYAASVLRHSRVNHFGLGTQLTRGSWLFKQELALTTGLRLTSSGETSSPLPLLESLPIVGGLPLFPGSGTVIPLGSRKTAEWGLLLGGEYYGIAQTSFSLELATRHIADYAEDLAASAYLEWRGESAARISRNFMNERLQAHLLAVFFNADGEFWDASGGALYRVNADYEFGRGLNFGAGLLIYQAGDQAIFPHSGKNDRIFAELKYSF